MLGPGCKSMPTGVNERSFYANLPPPSVNYSQWSAWSDKIWSAPRIRVDKISKVWRFEGGISLSNSTSHHGLFYCRYVAFFSHKTSPIMKELRGGGGVETMNAYAPLDCPRPTCGRNFKSLPPPLQDHTTLSSLPIYSILDHECREGGGFSKVITSSLTLNKFSQFKKRNFKWISQNRPSCYVPIKFA